MYTVFHLHTRQPLSMQSELCQLSTETLHQETCWMVSLLIFVHHFVPQIEIHVWIYLMVWAEKMVLEKCQGTMHMTWNHSKWKHILLHTIKWISSWRFDLEILYIYIFLTVITFSCLKQNTWPNKQNGYQTIPFSVYIHNLMFFVFHFGLFWKWPQVRLWFYHLYGTVTYNWCFQAWNKCYLTKPDTIGIKHFHLVCTFIIWCFQLWCLWSHFYTQFVPFRLLHFI